MDFECIDERFSTTRRLTRTPKEPDPCFQLPNPHIPNFVGGLRTRGFYKAEGPEPIITVITIAYNCAASIEETMLSVLNQTYSNIEYVVIDGGSTDGTLEVIRKYDHAIDYWLSEPDRGIYDAMNKGIRASTGQWLNCLNVKDVFFSNDTIQLVADKYLKSGARFIYSDVPLRNTSLKKDDVGLHRCDHKKRVVNQQASIYRKDLHCEHGLFLVTEGITVSDVIFFSLIDQKDYLKAEEPIAIYDLTGVSNTKASTEMRFVVDYLVNRMPKYKFLLNFHLFYYRKELEAFLVRIVRASRKAIKRLNA